MECDMKITYLEIEMKIVKNVEWTKYVRQN